MGDAGNRLPVTRPADRGQAGDLARRRCEDAMTALAAIMNDEAAASAVRFAAANSILTWSHAGRVTVSTAKGEDEPERSMVSVEWSSPPRPNYRAKLPKRNAPAQ